MVKLKKYFVRVSSEYEFIIEVDENSELDPEEVAWEQDWLPLLHRADIEEMYEIE